MSWLMKTLGEAVYSKFIRLTLTNIGSIKSISLSVQEILAREVERKYSYFVDESDEESEEEEEEGY